VSQSIGISFRTLSTQLSEIDDSLAFLNRNMAMALEEQRLGNVLLHNITELLRVPDSEKERQRSIELGIKFFVNASKDPDLYADALEMLLKAESLMKQDYFVLHRIGCIYLHVEKYLAPKKALDYFVRAAKYASVESDPDAFRLANVLTAHRDAVNSDISSSPEAMRLLASDSYEMAAFAAYVLGNNDDAVSFQAKAVARSPTPRNRFNLAKYQTRHGSVDEAVKTLDHALEDCPRLIYGVFLDLDLANERRIIDAVGAKVDSVNGLISSVINVCQSFQRTAADTGNQAEAARLREECETLLTQSYEDKVARAEDIATRGKAMQELSRLEHQLAQLVKNARADQAVSCSEAVAIWRVAQRYLVKTSQSTRVLKLAHQCEDVIRRSTLVNSIGMAFKLIPFRDGELFYVGIHEVTNAQWKQVMACHRAKPGQNVATVIANTPSKWQDDDRPVESVSWDEAVAFCRHLSELPEERQAGRVYRLPMDAEWEYACRAGSTRTYSFGDSERQLGEYGWHAANSGGQTHPVGQKKPNDWGLYDMHGNVLEWCGDDGVDGGGSDGMAPHGTPSASGRILRGGGWGGNAECCESAFRIRFRRSSRTDDAGFRLAMSLPAAATPQEAVAR